MLLLKCNDIFANMWNASCIASADFLQYNFFCCIFSRKKLFPFTFLSSHFLIVQKRMAMRYHHCEIVATLPLSIWPFGCVGWTSTIILMIVRQTLWSKFLFVIVDILLCYKYKKWKRECSFYSLICVVTSQKTLQDTSHHQNLWSFIIRNAF